jgi:hypothetical protein
MISINTKLLVGLIIFALSVNIKAQINFTMNEVYSRGTTAEPDWIEIYNLTSSIIDISGYKIFDSGGQAGTKPKKEFLTGSTISANGFLVVVTDDTAESGFGLSSNGETVWIENSSGIVVDSVVIPALQTIESYSRVPNGGSWVITNSITKGSSNIYSNPTTVVMNEIYSRGTTENPDWIELYNPSSSQVDISGYKIYDGGGYAGTKPKMVLPTGSVLNANGFIVIITDDTTESGFGLSSNGEEVWLEDASGYVIDDVTFSSMADTQSYSRIPDGNSNWQLTNYITKGFANAITSIDDENNSISDYQLNQNYPNPFNPTTTISFTIAATSDVTLKVFNVLGKEVATVVNGMKSAGNYFILFNSSGLSSGVYFYQLKANNIVLTKKFVLMK